MRPLALVSLRRRPSLNCDHSTVGSLLAFAVLFGLCSLVFAPAFDILPVGGDNYYVLAWADRTPAPAIFRVDPSIYPEWRPLAYLTVWLQYAGLGSLGRYFLVNIVSLALCGWLVFRLLLTETESVFASCAAAVLAVTDARVVRSVTWIVERQSSMACLFGLMALALVQNAVRRKSRGPVLQMVLVVLLVASALSKEYGLAFAAAIAAHATLVRRYDMALSAAAASVVYLVARLLTVTSAVRPTCLSSGFLFDQRTLCTDGIGISVAPQALYNVGATFFNTVLPGLLTQVGAIGVSQVRLAIGILALQLAVTAWWCASPLVRTSLLIVMANAVLNFMLYRDRNQFIGVFAFSLVVGAGIARVERRTVGAAGRRADLRFALVVIVASILCLQAVRTRAQVTLDRAEMRQADPCRYVAPGDSFAHRVNAVYGRPDSDCRRSPAEAER